MQPHGIAAVAGAFLAAAIIFYLLLHAVQRVPTTPNAFILPPAQYVDKCEQATSTALSSRSRDIQTIDAISAHCLTLVSSVYRLEDYDVRRSAFYEQYSETTFLLWLVICITVSGIILAAVQLVTAYRLSIALGENVGEQTQLTIDTKRLSVRSTVSGLIILAMSFAFFLVYVIYIYPLEDTGSSNPSPSAINSSPNTAQSYVMQPGPIPSRLMAPTNLLNISNMQGGAPATSASQITSSPRTPIAK